MQGWSSGSKAESCIEELSQNKTAPTVQQAAQGDAQKNKMNFEESLNLRLKKLEQDDPKKQVAAKQYAQKEERYSPCFDWASDLRGGF